VSDLGGPTRNIKFPPGIARNVNEARKPPNRDQVWTFAGVCLFKFRICKKMSEFYLVIPMFKTTCCVLSKILIFYVKHLRDFVIL